MATPGLLLRLSSTEQTPPDSATTKLADELLDLASAVHALRADDNKDPQSSVMYELPDIELLVQPDALYEKDKIESASAGELVDWHVYKLIGHSKNAFSDLPVTGSVMVCVGSTPSAGTEQVYHDWYNQEHMGLLANVPGWKCCKRYELVQNYGSGAGVAPFIGLNNYAEQNGLGGPIWQKSSATDWTARVRSNTSRPNHRRVWRVLYSCDGKLSVENF